MSLFSRVVQESGTRLRGFTLKRHGGAPTEVSGMHELPFGTLHIGETVWMEWRGSTALALSALVAVLKGITHAPCVERHDPTGSGCPTF